VNTSKYMDLKELQALLNISRQTIERQMLSGNFPKKIHITPRRVRWLRIEVEAWQRSKEIPRYQRANEPGSTAIPPWAPLPIDSSHDEPEKSR
jgi:predicted DNA-binding transcriptional regulator AlpA